MGFVFAKKKSVKMFSRFIGKFFVICVFLGIVTCNPISNNDDQMKLLEKTREMKSYMNNSIDPCENFHEFACGNWATLYPASKDDELNTSFMKNIKESHDKKALEMLENDNDSADTITDKKIRNFYKSCMKLKDGISTEKMIDFISEFGKMPALNESEWDESNFDWLETVARIQQKYGYSIIISFDIMADLKDKKVNRIFVGEQEFPLQSKSIYTDPSNAAYIEMYKTSITGTLKKALGLKTYNAFKIAEHIVNFEIELAEGMVEDKVETKLDTLISNTTVNELHEKYEPEIDIKKLFNLIFDETPSDMVYEYNPLYLQNLKKILQKSEKQKIANYIYYQLVRLISFDPGRTQEKLQRACKEKVQKYFSQNIDNMIYRRYNNKDTENDIYRIWNNLKAIFKAKLQSPTALNWVTNTTRETSIEKLDALKLIINSYTDRDFEKEYKDLETSEHDFVGNFRNISIFEAKKKFALLHKAPARLDAAEILATTPANLLTDNIVLMPVAVLQPYCIYSPNYPDALKFGITGFLLGHEMIHTFDNTGRQFTKTGNLEDWWDEKSESQYNKRRECFTEQYHGYIYGKNPLPRNQEQSENIADNGGLKLAYDAYMHVHNNAQESDNNLPDTMPDFEYTPQQLFFIGFAQFWCSDVEAMLRDLQAAVDNHTPDMFRTIGTLSNVPEFAEAFKCPASSKMNPATKCEMYR